VLHGLAATHVCETGEQAPPAPHCVPLSLAGSHDPPSVDEHVKVCGLQAKPAAQPIGLSSSSPVVQDSAHP
jgi:hypothetical protein